MLFDIPVPFGKGRVLRVSGWQKSHIELTNNFKRSWVLLHTTTVTTNTSRSNNTLTASTLSPCIMGPKQQSFKFELVNLLYPPQVRSLLPAQHAHLCNRDVLAWDPCLMMVKLLFMFILTLPWLCLDDDIVSAAHLSSRIRLIAMRCTNTRVSFRAQWDWVENNFESVSLEHLLHPLTLNSWTWAKANHLQSKRAHLFEQQILVNILLEVHYQTTLWIRQRN